MEKKKNIRVVLLRINADGVHNNESKRTDAFESDINVDNGEKEELLEDANDSFITEVSGSDRSWDEKEYILETSMIDEKNNTLALGPTSMGIDVNSIPEYESTETDAKLGEVCIFKIGGAIFKCGRNVSIYAEPFLGYIPPSSGHKLNYENPPPSINIEEPEIQVTHISSSEKAVQKWTKWIRLIQRKTIMNLCMVVGIVTTYQTFFQSNQILNATINIQNQTTF